MCIGESTTAYGGADAYPRQLEQVLYEMRPSMRFRVYNQGVMCGNTGVLLDILPTGLEQSRPHIVVSMMGANDTGQLIPLAGLPELTTTNPLARSRVYRLYRFLEASVERARQKAMAGERDHLGHRDDIADARWQEARKLAREAEFVPAIEAFADVCRTHPRDARPIIEMAETALMLDDGRNPFAEKALKDAIQVDPTQIAAWIDLGYLYEKNGRVDKSDACFERALGCSFGVIARRRQYYNALVRYLARKGDDAQAERLFSFLEEATPDTDAVLDSAAWYYGQRRNLDRQRACRDRADALRALRLHRHVAQLQAPARSPRRQRYPTGVRGLPHAKRRRVQSALPAFARHRVRRQREGLPRSRRRRGLRRLVHRQLLWRFRARLARRQPPAGRARGQSYPRRLVCRQPARVSLTPIPRARNENVTRRREARLSPPHAEYGRTIWRTRAP